MNPHVATVINLIFSPLENVLKKLCVNKIGSNSYEFIMLLLNADERLQILIGDNFPMDP